MRPPKMCRAFFVLCVAAAAGLATQQAFADSYTVYQVSSRNQGNVDNVGLTDSGSLTTLIITGTVTYSTFTPPSTTTVSSTLPALTFDNGSTSGCPANGSGLAGVSMVRCNNGREVFSALAATGVYPNLYLFEAGAPLQLIYSGGVDNILLDAMGDIAFVGTTGINADTNYLYYDTSSRAAVTPEPSSLLLLLTGGMGTAAMMRWRWRQV